MKHYENTPIQLYNFTTKKMKTFRWKILVVFIFQNIDCGYSIEPPRRGGSNEYPLGEAILTSTHNLCFWAEIRKVMYIPVNPGCTVEKWCLRGSKLYRCVFVMESLGPSKLAFYVNLHRVIIGPSATLTGRWRPDIDLRRMLTGLATRRSHSKAFDQPGRMSFC